MAIGDGDNDTAMLAAAGTGIAMANGSANAKAAADRTGPDAEPHGVADLCRELWPRHSNMAGTKAAIHPWGPGLPPLYGARAKALILGSFPAPKAGSRAFSTATRKTAFGR